MFGWENTPLQQMWLGDVDESFVAAEPRPLCALLSGNTPEWCEQPREPWRGIQGFLSFLRYALIQSPEKS
ncbi:MAG: hypothetical protein ACLQNE_42850 [Thermoguttaceae bacterium]